MATTKEFRDFILEQLSILENITCRSMMGEYLLYFNGVLFGGIYDGRLLFKITTTNSTFNMPQEIPYKGAKPMFMFEDFENKDILKDVVLKTCEGLLKK